jgi:hypothetical protein
MVSYVENTIASFAVWFRTPAGLFATFDEARDHCVALDQNPSLYLSPVAVALGGDGVYEEVSR